jgi:hypothetical protein
MVRVVLGDDRRREREDASPTCEMLWTAYRRIWASVLSGVGRSWWLSSWKTAPSSRRRHG